MVSNAVRSKPGAADPPVDVQREVAFGLTRADGPKHLGRDVGQQSARPPERGQLVTVLHDANPFDDAVLASVASSTAPVNVLLEPGKAADCQMRGLEADAKSFPGRPSASLSNRRDPGVVASSTSTSSSPGHSYGSPRMSAMAVTYLESVRKNRRSAVTTTIAELPEKLVR